MTRGRHSSHPFPARIVILKRRPHAAGTTLWIGHAPVAATFGNRLRRLFLAKRAAYFFHPR